MPTAACPQQHAHSSMPRAPAASAAAASSAGPSIYDPARCPLADLLQGGLVLASPLGPPFFGSRERCRSLSTAAAWLPPELQTRFVEEERRAAWERLQRLESYVTDSVLKKKPARMSAVLAACAGHLHAAAGTDWGTKADFWKVIEVVGGALQWLLHIDGVALLPEDAAKLKKKSRQAATSSKQADPYLHFDETEARFGGTSTSSPWFDPPPTVGGGTGGSKAASGANDDDKPAEKQAAKSPQLRAQSKRAEHRGAAAARQAMEAELSCHSHSNSLTMVCCVWC